MTAAAAPAAEAAADPAGLDEGRLALLRRTICHGATDDDVRLYLEFCRASDLDPMSGLVHLYREGDRVTFRAGIDGMRVIAERTGERDGEDDPEWCGPDGVWKNVWTDTKPPVAARVRVYRKGHGRPYVGVAAYAFFAQRQDGKLTRAWSKGAAHMLCKCAEALALRKGWPAQLGAVFSHDEMEQAEPPAPDAALLMERIGKASTALDLARIAADCTRVAKDHPSYRTLRAAYKARRDELHQVAAAPPGAGAADAAPAEADPRAEDVDPVDELGQEVQDLVAGLEAAIGDPGLLPGLRARVAKVPPGVDRTMLESLASRIEASLGGSHHEGLPG